ncbi:hypothetical protein PoB_002372600 [Plakobranchus ocellatus]|uniref:Uncharacterized protein n=1 Tax=Plakobranchus ocellatus TaxID=259542 RepID=A0AAV3ZD87_9GAST|nr:hypothetical protein PoB_002372600 [Plakobranchus ocellatus]
MRIQHLGSFVDREPDTSADTQPRVQCGYKTYRLLWIQSLKGSADTESREQSRYYVDLLYLEGILDKVLRGHYGYRLESIVHTEPGGLCRYKAYQALSMQS